MKNKISFWQGFTVSLIILTLILISPFATSFAKINSQILTENIDLFRSTLLNTILYALSASFILVLFGFFGALLLLKVPIESFLGKNMALLIFPVVLGNISISFITKLLIGDSAAFSWIIESGFVIKLSCLIFLQIWQYGLLFVYIFWMQLQNTPKNMLDYAYANHFLGFQIIKDIYLPMTKNLWVLLSCIGLISSLYEGSKIQYLFKSSQGTDSELITNWMSRSYQSNLLVSAEQAQNLVFNAGDVVTITSIFVLVIVFLFINTTFGALAGLKKYPNRNPKQVGVLPYFFNKVWAYLLLISIILPISLCIAKINFSLNADSISLLFPIFMTFLATIIAVTIAISFGVSSRLGWQQTLSSFNNRSVLFFISLFILMLIPPIVILISGYKWMGVLGYNSITTIYLIWFLGHTLLALPMLGSFVLFNHFRVSTNEINYLKVSSLSRIDIIKYSFLTRFKAEYLLLFIIGFSFIWNEAIFNNLFSDYIPSFVSGLKMLITGRGADYSLAFGYLFISLILSFFAVGLWRFILEKGIEKQKL